MKKEEENLVVPTILAGSSDDFSNTDNFETLSLFKKRLKACCVNLAIENVTAVLMPVFCSLLS